METLEELAENESHQWFKLCKLVLGRSLARFSLNNHEHLFPNVFSLSFPLFTISSIPHEMQMRLKRFPRISCAKKYLNINFYGDFYFKNMLRQDGIFYRFYHDCSPMTCKKRLRKCGSSHKHQQSIWRSSCSTCRMDFSIKIIPMEHR